MKTQLRDSIQIEIDAWYLYARLAEHETDDVLIEVFRQMSEIEKSHAVEFCKNAGLDFQAIAFPSWRAKTLNRIGKILGYDYVLGALMETEKVLSEVVIQQKKKDNIHLTGAENSHAQVLKNILANTGRASGTRLARFEKRHRSVGGNAIRAAVLGGNDGLVSNFSLVMGVAGATSGGEGVLLAGVAGLLAGALSMALGEWISVKSSQELYQNQMQLEMDELELNPEGERKELVLIYMAKGLSREQAENIVDELMTDKKRTHEILVKEELGINAEELEGSAMEAAVSSFVLFAVGAIIPVMPFFFTNGFTAIWISALGSAIGLFVIGAAITLFTGRNVLYSGGRQVLFGMAAAAITFGIGKWIGVSVAG
jgi:VIT1/CCC1 family predicted Fe2+/Mn2+ transporter